MQRSLRTLLIIMFLFVLGGVSANGDINFPTLYISDVTIEEEELPSFDIDLSFAFNEMNLKAIEELYRFRVVAGPSADISIFPNIEKISYSHDSVNEVEVLELLIRWDVTGKYGNGTLSFDILGAAGTINGALLSGLELYRESIGYEVVSQLSGGDSFMVDSTFNDYVTGIIPESATASIGDEFLIYDPMSTKELALLTLASLREPEEGERLSGEYYINYSDVSIQPGIPLFQQSDNKNISIKLSEIQTLGLTGLSSKVYFRGATGALQYSAGVDLGYCWNDSVLSLTWPIEAKGFHFGINQGFLVRFDQGLKLQEASSRTRYAMFLDIGADLGLGYYVDTSGGASDWIYYGSYHAGLGWYSSSTTEFGVDLGYQLTYGFSDGSIPLRSTPYISPHVTFRL